MDLTTAGLIADIELSALLPDGMYENSDLISFLNDGYFSDILPFIMRHREDFFITYEDFSPAATLEIPVDAIAQKLKDVQLIRDNRFYNLPRLSMGEVTANANWNKPNGFYIQDNTIVFYPEAPTNDIRLLYFKRPHYMEDSTIDTDEDNVDSSTVYEVTGVSGTTVMVSPNPVAQLGTGITVDFTHSKSYQPFNVVDDIALVTGPSGSQFTAASAELAATFTIGDYLCNPSYTAFPKLPLEVREMLVQAAVVKSMISMKDREGYKLAKDALNEAKQAVSGLISPRVDNEVKKIVNTNGMWGRTNRGWRR